MNTSRHVILHFDATHLLWGLRLERTVIAQQILCFHFLTTFLLHLTATRLYHPVVHPSDIRNFQFLVPILPYTPHSTSINRPHQHLVRTMLKGFTLVLLVVLSLALST